MIHEVIILVVSVIILLGLALTVLSKDMAGSGNRLFAAVAFLSAADSVSYFLFLYHSDHLFFARLIILISIFLGLSFSWMAIYLKRRRFVMTRARWIELLITMLVAVPALTPLYFSNVVFGPNNEVTAYYSSLVILFVIHVLIFFVLPVVSLAEQMKRSSGFERSQLSYITIGGGAGIALTFSANFIGLVVLGTSKFTAWSPLYLLIFGISIWIAILRYRLLNIRAVVARSAAYVLLLIIIVSAYSAGLFLIANSFSGEDFKFDTQNIVSIIFATTLVFTFQPLRRFFEKITDRIFYRDRYDPQIVLSELSGILVSELELQKILKRSLAHICEELHLQYGALVIMNHGRFYRLEQFGKVPAKLLDVTSLHHLDHTVSVVDHMVGGPRKVFMDEHFIRVSLTLRTHQDHIGYIVLGDKMSGGIYSDQDIELLEIIAKQLAIAIQNSRSYTEIQDFNHTLQARVEHATSRLRVANRHLKELDQAKDEFISMASHQLRTPLTTIKGYLSMMLEGDAGHISKTQTQFVNYAYDSSERMVSLISNLLDVSRLSAGRFIIQTKPTDINMIIQDEFKQLETRAVTKGLKITYNPPEEIIPVINLDDNKTRQVLMNLIDNAIYYTTSGSVDISLTQNNGSARVLIVDTGIGVPMLDQKSLFTKFYRASNAQAVRPDGTGLGLYIAKHVIEDQGGSVIFESEEGKGSTFGFEIPITQTLVEA